MSTVLAPPMIEATQRFVIPGVSWNQYVQILDGLGEQRGIRTSYDGETLELMTTSLLHERCKLRLGRFLEALTLELGLDLDFGGQMTFRREDLEKGLEPDQCYWIRHAADVRGRNELDFTVDPPPDLCIEIEVSRSVVSRLGIYSALGVPEVWRYDARTLTVLRLEEGEYVAHELSVEVPDFPVAEIADFLDPSEVIDENVRLKRFIEWVRDRMSNGG